MSLVANVDLGETANDVWGYVAEDGTEYAIIGTINSTQIYSLKDPTNPALVIEIPGDRSTWRDIKTNGTFIYVIADRGNDGLLAIDMAAAPENIQYEYFRPVLNDLITTRFDSTLVTSTMVVDSVEVTDSTYVLETVSDTLFTFLQTCHNLYSTDGYLYLAGCNGGGQFNGVLIFDPSVDPFKPELIGKADVAYAHDVYVNGNTMFASEISRGVLGIYDISDKTDPKLLTFQRTGFSFTHNAWTNDDATVVFTTDEKANAFVEAYDISDLPNVTMLDRYRPLATQGLGVVPHNTHYDNGFLYTSYYTDGITVVDAHKPDNLVQVGQYDTWNGPDGGFNGNWGAYPFLPSGLILVSDISTGLYVLEQNVPRASYLEGTVIDENTGIAINGVLVEILSDDVNEGMSDASGIYKTGQATSGNFEVQFLHKDYIPKTIPVDFVEGECILLDVTLAEAEKVKLDITSSISNEAPLGGVIVKLTSRLNEFDFVTTDAGTFISSRVTQGVYRVTAGKWGYKTIVIDTFAINADINLDIQLEEGIEDNFTADLGWNATGNASSGAWVRAKPLATFSGSKAANVTEDLPNDEGELCYMTGNGGGSAGTDDVDNGEVILTSPKTDLTSYENPIVKYSLWFYNDGGVSGQVDDTLSVYVLNSLDTVLLEEVADTNRLSGFWRDQSQIELKGLINLTEDMHFQFVTGDFEIGHFVEAGVDGFSIIDKTTTSTSDTPISEVLLAYPNPTIDQINIDYDVLTGAQDWMYSIINLKGQLVYPPNSLTTEAISLAGLAAGSYILNIHSESAQKEFVQKIVKL